MASSSTVMISFEIQAAFAVTIPHSGHRLSERSNVLKPITPPEQQYVIAYLVAISPDLQQGLSNQRDQEKAQTIAKEIARNVSTGGTPIEEFNLADSRKVFEVSCMQCHASSLLESHPPRTQKQAEELVNRMVDNGLDLPEADLRKIIFYLKTTYAK